MVRWLAIEDTGPEPTPVWLTRANEKDDWKPLRKSDSQRLQQADPNDTCVLVEGARATVNLPEKTLHYHYYSDNTEQKQPIDSATWFLRRGDLLTSSQEPPPTTPPLVPLDPVLALAVEDLYQHADQASQHQAALDDTILAQRIPIADNYHISIHPVDGAYVLRKSPNQRWFAPGKAYDLQRGYHADHVVPGEDDEEQLRPTQHVFFVVHGIGEALWSNQSQTIANSLVQELEQCRRKMQAQQVQDWKQVCQQAEREGSPLPEPPHRVEFLPIMWYDSIHSSSSDLMTTLSATTLQTIPALRQIANDVILDVLLYLTPNFCYDVLQCVTDQIIRQQQIFLSHHPDFTGSFSLMGHSLGSVICWDLLTVLQQQEVKNTSSNAAMPPQGQGVHIASQTQGYSTDIGYQSYASQEHAAKAQNGSVGPSLPKPLTSVLPFQPVHTILLGSPIGLFLTLRGAHPVFDAMRNNLPDGPGKPAASPFRLPCQTMHNIFHPSDPVAYRIEPLLLSKEYAEPLPPPLYLTRKGENVRFHIRAMEFTGKIRKSVMERTGNLGSLMNVVSDQAHTILTQLEQIRSKDPPPPPKEATKGSNGNIPEQPAAPLRFPLAGASGRLDYQLQTNVIDNEYVSAVLAHSSYFSNNDVIAYTIDLTTKPVSEEE
eukprot:Nitzschia sp. Nitz4//scaffold22_size323478//14171//16370//NITZ4_000492-RA/size323478-augustus-gene-0.220-mRNA-1//-1//CDS//3329542890//1823//frame0